jgi:hypothetical protein
MKQKNHIAILILAFSILISSMVVTFGSNSPVEAPIGQEVNDEHVLTSKYKEDMKLIVEQVVDLTVKIAVLERKVNDLESCLIQTTLGLTQNQQNIFVCP